MATKTARRKSATSRKVSARTAKPSTKRTKAAAKARVAPKVRKAAPKVRKATKPKKLAAAKSKRVGKPAVAPKARGAAKVRKAKSKACKIEYRTDRQAIVHVAIGKASFDERKLLENYAAVIDEIARAKPAAAKGRYILSATLTNTMGPGIRVDTAKTSDRDIVAGFQPSEETAEAVG